MRLTESPAARDPLQGEGASRDRAASSGPRRRLTREWFASRPRLRAYEPGDERRIEPPNPDVVLRLSTVLEASAWIHRYELHGFEHIPREGPGLLVSFHPFYCLGMVLLIRRVIQRDHRVVRGLTDHLVFSIPGLRDAWTNLGVLDGTRDNALRLFESGQLAICMPGGALEWSRSSRQRRQLRWGEHRGYARLAVAAGVPIIPTCCPAADDLYWVLTDGWSTGERLRDLLGARRVLPIPLAVGLGPLARPIKLIQHVAPPQWPLGPDAGTPEERARELDERVRGIMRVLLQRN